jgi:hypothetical protein
MSAANREQFLDRDNPVRVTLTHGANAGETVELPYRKAVGLLSLQRAVLADEKPKRGKKAAS